VSPPPSSRHLLVLNVDVQLVPLVEQFEQVTVMQVAAVQLKEEAVAAAEAGCKSSVSTAVASYTH
jgi:hypothetical protein